MCTYKGRWRLEVDMYTLLVLMFYLHGCTDGSGEAIFPATLGSYLEFYFFDADQQSKTLGGIIFKNISNKTELDINTCLAYIQSCSHLITRSNCRTQERRITLTLSVFVANITNSLLLLYNKYCSYLYTFTLWTLHTQEPVSTSPHCCTAITCATPLHVRFLICTYC